MKLLKRASKVNSLIIAAVLILSSLAVVLAHVGFSKNVAQAEVFGTAEQSTITETVSNGDTSFVFENEIMKTTVSLPSGGGVLLTSILNKEAGNREMLSNKSDVETRLFKYVYTPYKQANYSILKSDDSGLKILKGAENGGFEGNGIKKSEIVMTHTDNKTKTVVGHKVEFWVGKESCPLQVKMEFDIYNKRSGMKYSTWIRNTDKSIKYTIAESNVIELGFERPTELASPKNYVLHYPQNQMWNYVENGVIEPHWKTVVTSSSYKDLSSARNIVAIIDETSGNGYGWYVAPEVNWQTQNGPEIPGHQGNTNYTYPFASINAYHDIKNICIFTNPGSVQLTLFPEEEFEYIDVNFTVFKAKDFIDGKMAAEEHMRRRFKFNDTNLIINTNDWDWLAEARLPNYYQDVIVPKAKLAGLEMVMMDDLWNTTRDSVDVIEELYGGDMKGWADWIKSEGFIIGLWYSLIGDDHNNGRDLADPVQLAQKKEMIEFLINEYHMEHQMIDLTEFWQTTFDTDYSHSADSVYRKNKLVRQMLNSLVEKYPWYKVKFTNEMDVYPTQGDRNSELGHLVNNGWLVIAGDATGFSYRQYVTTFGHQPLNVIYSGGRPDGSLERYYGLMISRNSKFNTDPGTWSNEGAELLGKFNAWRRTDKINNIVNNTMRPVHFGKNWTDYKNWDPSTGPYAWGWMDEGKNEGLIIASAVQQSPYSRVINGDMRFVDAAKTYVVTDITMDKYGNQATRYIGTFSGTDLIANGLELDLSGGSEVCGAFWLQAVEAEEDMPDIAYSDNNVTKAQATITAGMIKVTAEGKPNSTGRFTVAIPSSNKGLGFALKFPSSGKADVLIPQARLTDGFTSIPYPESIFLDGYDVYLKRQGNNIDAMTMEFENGFSPSISYNSGSSNAGVLVSPNTNTGKYVDFVLSSNQVNSIKDGGRFNLSYTYEAHTENRGKAIVEVFANGRESANKLLTSSTIDLKGGQKSAATAMLGEVLFPETISSIAIRITIFANNGNNSINVMNFKLDPTAPADALEADGLPERSITIGSEYDIEFINHETAYGAFDFDEYWVEIIESDFGVIDFTITDTAEVKLKALKQGGALIKLTNKNFPVLTRIFSVTISAITGVEIKAPDNGKITVTNNPEAFKYQMNANVLAPSGTKDLRVLWSVTDKDGNQALNATINSETGELTLTGNGEITITATAQDGSAKRHSTTVEVEGFDIEYKDKVIKDSPMKGAAIALIIVGSVILALGAVCYVFRDKVFKKFGVNGGVK